MKFTVVPVLPSASQTSSSATSPINTTIPSSSSSSSSSQNVSITLDRVSQTPLNLADSTDSSQTQAIPANRQSPQAGRFNISLVKTEPSIDSGKRSDIPNLNNLTREDKPLSRGGQGAVYLLSDGKGKSYIGKIFQQDATLTAEKTAYEAVGKHRNIVASYGITKIGQTEYLVLEKVDGYDLEKIILTLDELNEDDPDIQTKDMASKLKLLLIEQLFDALKHIEDKRFSHADLKPENILVTKEAVLKLIDFGLAKSCNTEVIGDGSIDYMAPEVVLKCGLPHLAQGQSADYTKADSYSAANVVLKLLTGFYLRQNGLNLTQQGRQDMIQAVKDLTQLEKILPDMADGWVFPDKEVELYDVFEERKTPLDEEVYARIVRPLQEILYHDRASINQIYPVVKELVGRYLTPEIRQQAIEFFQDLMSP